jgi:peptide deformylase
MTILDIVTIESKGHKLESPAELIIEEEFNSVWLRALAQDLWDTINASKSTGIAAPQVGINKQIIAFGGKPSLNFPDFNVPFSVLINPTYEAINDEKVTLWEHCLSLPGKRGHTVRHASIRYDGFDVAGNRIKGEAEGILAVLLQHEIDHIKGKLFPVLVQNPSEYGDIATFEAIRGPGHHIEDGLQTIKSSEKRKDG